MEPRRSGGAGGAAGASVPVASVVATAGSTVFVAGFAIWFINVVAFCAATFAPGSRAGFTAAGFTAAGFTAGFTLFCAAGVLLAGAAAGFTPFPNAPGAAASPPASVAGS